MVKIKIKIKDQQKSQNKTSTKDRKIKIKKTPTKTNKKIEKKIKDDKMNIKRIPYKPLKEQYPLITPKFWVLQNNKKFPSFINQTFIKYKLSDKTKIKSIDGQFKPFLYQLFLRDYMQYSSPYRGILMMHGLGSGKCFRLDTPIMMYDGTIKKVQDVQIGDLVMGDDSTPRTVMNLSRGRDIMYDVVPIKGDKYTVNSEHVLSLKYSCNSYITYIKSQKNKPYCVSYLNEKTMTKNAISFATKDEAEIHLNKIKKKDLIFDIPIKEYQKLSKSTKAQLKGYRKGIEFDHQDIDFDPYIIGFWLGDGSKRDPVITCQDPTILSYLRNNLPKYDLMLSFRSKYDYGIRAIDLKNENKLFSVLKKYNLKNNKHIPKEYKFNSREIRLKLLAGLIDSDGYCKQGMDYEITQKNKSLAEDILYLCRSLGFGAYMKECKKSCMYKSEKKEGTYYKIHFSGIGLEEIPVLVPRKKANPRKQVKDVLVTGITVKEVGEDNYYGFEVDDNHRFLLGDFTVTHNSCSAITIAENLKEDMNIIGLMPASLKNNFIGEKRKDGLLFCGDPKYQQDPKLIDENYTFISSNASNTLQQLNSIDINNHVIIVDEAHNLTSRMVGGLAGDNKQGRQIYNKLMDARDVKIVALTGTPIVNKPYEAAVLLNVLHGYMYVTIFNIAYVSPKYGQNWNLRELEKELEAKDYIDYVEINKANKTIEVHLRLKPWHQGYQDAIKDIVYMAKKMEINIEYYTYKQYTLFPDGGDGEGEKEFDKYFINMNNSLSNKDVGIKNAELLRRRMLGLISYYQPIQKGFPEVKLDEYVEVNMSSYQFKEYERVRQEERSSRKLAEIRVFTRQFSNFVFPAEIQRPGIGKRIMMKEKGLSANMEANNKRNEDIAKVMSATENEEEKDEVKREELKRYQKEVTLALEELSKNKDKYLTKSKLGTYSNKMKAMLDNIDKSRGLVFVYSDFRSLEGVEIFSRVLEANGYEKYDPADKSKNSKKPKYALYTGSEDFTERQKIKSLFTTPDNKYGKYIKIILATSAGAEGLNLKNIRQVHIMEPYWNNVRIKQVIGRAVRRDSHAELPKDEQNVSVFRYLSLISPEDQADLKPKDKLSTDQIILDIANKKEKITNEMLHLMKETAVDCVLNAGGMKEKNNKEITCFNFGQNVDGIAYVPRLGKDLGRGVEAEMRTVEHVLRHGALDTNEVVYFIENKKLYKASDKLKRNPITKIPKIKKKVAVDLDSQEVYDHDAAMKSKTKVRLGYFDNDSKFYKK